MTIRNLLIKGVDINEPIRFHKDDDSKTITFTKEELEALKEYLFCNPCSGGCVCEVSDKVDCYDLKKNGEYKCKFKQLTRQIESKLEVD